MNKSMSVALPPPRPGAKVGIFPSHRHKTTGEMRWRLRYRALDGSVFRTTVGSEAKARAAKARIELESFATRFLGQQPRPLMMSFEQLRDLQLRRCVGKDSLKHDEMRWRTVLLFFDGEVKSITEMRPSDIDRFRCWLLKRKTRHNTPHSPATVNRYLALLRSAYNFAIEDGLVRDNPVKRTHFFKEKERDRILEGSEFKTLTAAADPELRAAIIIAVETTLRESSIAQIQRAWIDIARRELRIPDTKNDDPVTVPLSIKALHAVQARLDALSGERLFKSTAQALGARFRYLVKRLGIKNLRFHDLRHTAATRLARAGVPIKTIMRIGGWRTVRSVMRYLKVDTRDLHAAIALVEAQEDI